MVVLEVLGLVVRERRADGKTWWYLGEVFGDGLAAQGVEPAKSNWARAIDTPPFSAYRVTVGITYTFGGLKINTQAQVLDEEDRPIRGLYAAGEIVGGFFYFDSLRASGLMHGAVFGRIGGANAAAG